jgi:cytoskeletal protein CcmA (bactofilin family)
MFGSKKDEEKMKQTKTTQTSSSSGINSLVGGTSVKGEIYAENDIRIDGMVSGKIECKGKLILGPKGNVDGEIICENAVIDGTFKGKLKVNDLLTVRETAVIDGDVITDQLNVESGAVFNVSCVMGGQKIKTIQETAVK